MSIYNSSRVAFDGILKKYKEYIEIYKVFNNGSVEGATPFGEFYWRFSYYVKYQDARVNNTGY